MMVAVKGRYDGATVVLEKRPVTYKCDVIVTFLENSEEKSTDDGSLAYLFKDYIDDGLRESIIDFGPAVGKEKW